MLILDCNEVVEMCYSMKTILTIVKYIIKLIQFSVPALLVVLGTWGMFKAMAKADDDKIKKEAVNNLIKRIIYGVVIFLVPFLVRLVLTLVEQNLVVTDEYGSSTSWIACWNNVDNKNTDYFSGCDDIYKKDNNNSNSNSNENKSTTSKTCYVYEQLSCPNTDSVKYSYYSKGDKYYNNASCRYSLVDSKVVFSRDKLNFAEGNLANYCETQCYVKTGSYPQQVYPSASNSNTCICIYQPSKKIVGSSTPPASGNYDVYSCNDEARNCETEYSLCRKVE